ncbi:FxSxx-COOH system tetratricopeptide repeat protein [Candidatus Frankia alpina]|uniref:FxSxx-COOH system tetratricopeptide repeat protein n=1 Tax=Candidatus Frankia alpina TaxID=2699483 RepID=UPI003AF78BDF
MFSRLLPHIVPSEVYRVRQPQARQLIEHVVRYLYQIGDFSTGLVEADRALVGWVADSGDRDPAVLILQGIKADILWALGRYPEAYELRRPVLDAITEVLGADLRSHGDFEAARELDEDSLARHRTVFGEEHQATLFAANNLAVDYTLTSSYARALETDQRNLADRRAAYTRDDAVWVVFSMAALARDLRHAGQYLDARELAEQAYLIYRDLVQRRILPAGHWHVLQHAKELSVARRKAGDFAAALELAREVHARYTNSPQYGSERPDTLAAGINLGNAQRVAGDPDEATVRIEKTVRRYRDVLGPDHPYTYGCGLNLALVHRQLGRIEEAETLLAESLAGLEARLGADHHFTLTCVVNLATARSALGRTDETVKMGEAALPRFRELLGHDHPHTLVCATNVALDLATIGRAEEGQALTEDTLRRYRRVLGEEHPDVRAGLRGERLDFDFEPPPL